MFVHITKNELNITEFEKLSDKISIFSKGLITYKNKIFIDNDIIRIFKQESLIEIQTIEKLIPELNGNFVICVYDGNTLLIANDRWGCYPLYYINSGENIYYSDNWRELIKYSSKKISSDNFIEYISLGHVFNSKTLIEDIFEIRPHSIIKHQVKPEFKTENISYWKLVHYFKSVNVIHKEKEFVELWNNQIDIYGKFLQQQNAKCFIPVTGGLDSRLLVTSFDKYNIGIRTATWGGDQTYFEIENAKAVIALMKNVISHESVILDTEYIKTLFHSDTEFNLLTTARIGNEAYYLQNYLPDTQYIIPGFSGDFMAGSHLKYKMKKWKSKNDIVEYICKFKLSDISQYLLNTNPDFKNKLKRLIYNSIEDDTDIISAFIRWDVEERQRQYIVRAGNFFKQTRQLIPFFDYKLMDFFLDLPFEELVNTKLYTNSQKKYFYKNNPEIFNVKRENSSPKVIKNSFVNEYIEKIQQIISTKRGEYKKTRYQLWSPQIDWKYLWKQVQIPDEYKKYNLQDKFTGSYALFFLYYEKLRRELSND